MRTRLLSFALLLLVIASSRADAAGGRVLKTTIPAPSLAGNKTGEAAAQGVAVYLPPGYDAEPNAHFPVLYLLHGIVDTYEVWTEGYRVPAILDAYFAVHPSERFIVVMPNGKSRFLGSYWANSPIIGNWEDFVAKDVVGYVDRTFRTLPDAAHRGVAGHSMGGLGTIRLAMHHPELFGAADAMSPCCLDADEDLGQANFAWFRALNLHSFADLDRLAKDAQTVDEVFPVALIALAQVVTPDVSSPIGAELPVREVDGELLPVDAVAARWQALLPVGEAPARREALLQLRWLAIESGVRDQFAHIPTGTARLSAELARMRVPHRFELYRGDHRDSIAERVRDVLIPGMARAFAASPHRAEGGSAGSGAPAAQ